MTEPAPVETTPAARPANDFGERIMHSFAAFISLLALVALGWCGIAKLEGAALAGLIAQHGPALIGIPVAVAMATCVVSGFRAIDGRLRIRLLGIETEGAGAAVLSWIVVFSGVVLAIRALW